MATKNKKPLTQPAADAEVQWPVKFRIPARFIADMPSIPNLDVADAGMVGRGVSTLLQAADAAALVALLDYVEPLIPYGDYWYVVHKLARAGVRVDVRDGKHVVQGPAAPRKARKTRKKAEA